MKKQLMKAAVAAAVTLPMLAQAGVYGIQDGVVRYYDTDAAVPAGGSDSGWDVGVDKMRWGIVGSEDLGNGMKALYQFEWNVDNSENGAGGFSSGGTNSENQRHAYVGLQGGFGTVRIGRYWRSSYLTVWGATDTGDAHANGADNLSGGNRVGQQILYTTPNMNGFTANAMAIMTHSSSASVQDDKEESGADYYELSAKYENGPLYLGFAYMDDARDTAGCSPSCTDVTTWGLAGKYSMGDLKVAATFGSQENDSTPGNSIDVDTWSIGASYMMGANEIHGAWRNRETDPTVGADTEEDEYYIGFRHYMSKTTRVFVEYKVDDVDTTGAASVESKMFAAGMRVDWKL